MRALALVVLLFPLSVMAGTVWKFEVDRVVLDKPEYNKIIDTAHADVFVGGELLLRGNSYTYSWELCKGDHCKSDYQDQYITYVDPNVAYIDVVDNHGNEKQVKILSEEPLIIIDGNATVVFKHIGDFEENDEH